MPLTLEWLLPGVGSANARSAQRKIANRLEESAENFIVVVYRRRFRK
jgi:hypothetical protein